MAPEASDRVRGVAASRDQAPKIQWDDSAMSTTYANVCNAVGTQEEVVLFFGISNPAQAGEAEVTVRLSERVILSPFAAKRLATLLGNVVEQYESRWGSLDPGRGTAAKS